MPRSRPSVDPRAAEALRPAEREADADIAALLRSASTSSSTFDLLVEIMARVLPLRAVVVVSRDPTEPPLMRIARRGRSEREPTPDVALSAMRYLAGDDRSLHDLERLQRAAAFEPHGSRWVALPLVGDDGSILGVLALATTAPVDEAGLAFMVMVARRLAPIVSRGRLWDVPHEELAREHQARAEAESVIEELAVVSRMTSLLASSLDYGSTLPELVRVLATEIGSGCVVDLADGDVARHVAHPPTLPRSPGVDKVLADVRRSGEPIAYVGGGAARRACAELAADWFVGVPIRIRDTVVGTMAVFGAAPRPPIPVHVAADLADRIGLAIDNGRAYARALASTRGRDELLSMVSHDLRSPLGAIMMNAAYVLEVTSKEPSQGPGRKELESILRAANRMKALLDDLLDVAALTEGAMSMKPGSWSARAAVTDALDILAPLAATAGIALINEVPEALAALYVDRDRLVQVLLNLVGNSIKFTPKGGSVRVRATTTEREAILRVVDTGRGMPAEQLSHVFERFWQAPGTRARTGIGLGLAISKSIVELSGGRLWAESAVGAGTTIAFTLPLERPRGDG